MATQKDISPTKTFTNFHFTSLYRVATHQKHFQHLESRKQWRNRKRVFGKKAENSLEVDFKEVLMH